MTTAAAVSAGYYNPKGTLQERFGEHAVEWKQLGTGTSFQYPDELSGTSSGYFGDPSEKVAVEWLVSPTSDLHVIIYFHFLISYILINRSYTNYLYVYIYIYLFSTWFVTYLLTSFQMG